MLFVRVLSFGRYIMDGLIMDMFSEYSGVKSIELYMNVIGISYFDY